MSNCCCSNTVTTEKIITIDYLYLDLDTCERCVGTDKVLESVLAELEPSFKLAGYSLKYNKVEIETEDIAKAYRFLSSPTIRVNGNDICESVEENNCDCCGDIAGTDVDCRTFSYNGESYEVPPKEMLAESIMKLAFTPQPSSCCQGKYELPDNLKKFFDGKKQKSSCCCCSCC